MNNNFANKSNFESSDFGTEMDNHNGLDHSLFGHSEASDTMLARGPSLHVAAGQSTEFFGVRNSGTRNTNEPNMKQHFEAPDNALEDSEIMPNDDFGEPINNQNINQRTES